MVSTKFLIAFDFCVYNFYFPPRTSLKAKGMGKGKGKGSGGEERRSCSGSGEDNAAFFNAASLEDALSILASHSGEGDRLRVVAGGTGQGVEKYYGGTGDIDNATAFLSLGRVPELRSTSVAPTT